MRFSLASWRSWENGCWGLREGKFEVFFSQSFYTAHTLLAILLLNILIIVPASRKLTDRL